MIEARLLLKLGLCYVIEVDGQVLIENVDIMQDILQLDRDVQLLKPTLDGLEPPSIQRDRLLIVAGVFNTFKYGGVACVVLGTCCAVFSVIVELI